jgi:hypothetical protein
LPSVSVTVMAHPVRSGMVHDLLTRLDRRPEVVWDRRNNEWDTTRRAWETADPTATHHLVLQDDALVCRDLIAGAERALAHVPSETVVSLYMGTRRPQRRAVAEAAAQARLGASWVAMRDLNWGVAICLPTSAIPAAIEAGDRSEAQDADRRIGDHFRRIGWPTWCTWPSLVDHRPGPSLLGHAGNDRHAHHFHGTDRSALDIDWTGPVIRMAGLKRSA